MFFTSNYGLHLFTMLSPAGSPPFHNVFAALVAVLLQFSGISTALQTLYQRGIQRASNNFQITHRHDTLCMLIQHDPER